MLRITVTLRESWRAVVATLLLVIGIHAAAPVGQPLQRQAGSAFSAATADVSLTQDRRERVTKQQAQRHAPPMMISALRPSTSVAVRPFDAAAAIAAYDATAPPLASISFSPLAPRAPPAA